MREEFLAEQAKKDTETPLLSQQDSSAGYMSTGTKPPAQMDSDVDIVKFYNKYILSS